MKFFRKTALFFLLMVATMSMQAQKDLQQFIPKDATFVVSMDLGNLNSKISFDKLKQYDFYKEGIKEMQKDLARDNEKAAKMIQNPEEAGIDIMGKSYMFGKLDKDASLFGFVFNIADSKKFTKFFKETIVPEAKGGVMGKSGKFQTFTDGEGSIAWNDKVGIISGGELNGSTEEGASRENLVSTFTKSVLASTPANSILSSNRYLRATKGKKSDMRMWMDYKWVLDMQTQGSELSEMGMGKMMDSFKGLYKDTDYMVDLNFNDGSIVMDSKMFTNNETLALLKKMSTGELNKNFTKYLPKDNLLGYFSLAINTKNMADGLFTMFNPMMEESGMNREQLEGMALGALNGMAGLNLDKDGLYELIRGDMVFAVTGLREFTVKKTQYDEDFNKIEVEAKEQLPEFSFMMSHGKKEDIMKIIELGVNTGALAKLSDGAYKLAIPIPDVPMDMYLAMKDGILFMTNNTDLVSGKLAKGYSKKDQITGEQLKTMKESSGAFFWDIPQTLNAASAYAAQQGMKDKSIDKIINVSKQSLESMIMTTSKTVKNSYDSEFTFNFVNKRMNSLDQLFSYINEMYLTSMSAGGM